MALIEHEVPEHGLIHLLELKKENLEIVEVTDRRKGVLHREDDQARHPSGRLAPDLGRADGKAEIPDESMLLEPGDSVLAILEPGKEDELRRVLVKE